MHPCRVLWDAVSQPFKRSQTGLFQGKMKQYGNNVPFSKKKTRRSWLPNVQHKRLASEVLDGLIRVKLTTRALRTIKKKGGLDNYLKSTSSTLLGDTGMRLRLRVLEEERRKLGRPLKEYRVLTPAELSSPENTVTDPRPIDVGGYYGQARLVQVKAAKVLGRDGRATVEESIAFLKKQESERAKRREKIFSEAATTATTASPA